MPIMQIRRSVKQKTKLATRILARKVIAGVFTLAVVASGTVLWQNTTNTPTASAATTPESCFPFDSTTGTVTGYYGNEAGDPSNPACPRGISIPDVIDGVSVSAIGQHAFAAV